MPQNAHSAKSDDFLAGSAPWANAMTREQFDAELARREAERGFQHWVVTLARAQGYRAVHFHQVARCRFGHTAIARNVEPGWPDLVLGRMTPTPRLIVAELKSATGRVQPAQRFWLALLKLVGVETYVWRPIDRAEIEQVLK